MDLHTLKSERAARHRKMRVGRGRGSGKGKTCGRGHKGQMSRKGHKHKLGFEGGQMRLIRRIPKRGFHSLHKEEFVIVNVKELARFDAGTEVTPSMMRGCGMIRGKGMKVKILGQGDIDRKLVVKAAAFSAGARAKIEAVGGVCEVDEN